MASSLHAGSRNTVSDLLRAGGAHDRRGHIRVLQDPCHGQLRHGKPGFLSDGPQFLDTGQNVVAHPALDHLGTALLICGPAALGGGLAGKVLAAEYALRHGGPHDLRDAQFLRRRHHLGLNDAPEHGVLRLVGDQLEAKFPGQCVAFAKLLSRPLADTDVQRLALPDDVRERLHRLFQRRLEIVAVGLVEVHVVRLEPGE